MSKYFFQPYKGNQYEDGYLGCKTLIVGAHHYCNHSELQCYKRCVEEGHSRLYDKSCPINQQLVEKHGEQWRDYYDLSNENTLELDCYLDDCPYPAYSAFTKYMLHIPDYLSEKQKRDFWNRVAFYNYVQHYLPDGFTPDYDEANKDMYDDDYEAFAEVIDELKPDIIYVWNPAVKKCLCKQGSNLIYKGRTDMQSLSVYLFVRKREYPESRDIVNEHLSLFPGESIKAMISTLHHLQLREHTGIEDSNPGQWLARYTWDRDLACYLIRSLLVNCKLFNDESRTYFIERITSELKDIDTVYTTFYWNELETEINKSGMEMMPYNGYVPPMEWSWFDYPVDQEQIQYSSVCLMYLKQGSDLYGAYIDSAITAERFKRLFILCDYSHIDSYLDLLTKNEHHYGIKYIYQFQNSKEKKDLILVEMEHDYTKHAKLFIADQEINTFLFKSEIKSLCPSSYLNKQDENWYKERIISFIGQDIKIPPKAWFKKQDKSSHGIPISKLSQLMKESVDKGLADCTPDGFAKPANWKNHHWVYLKDWFVVIFSSKSQQNRYKFSVAQLIQLFGSKDICKNKPPQKRDPTTEKIDNFFHEIFYEQDFNILHEEVRNLHQKKKH